MGYVEILTNLLNPICQIESNLLSLLRKFNESQIRVRVDYEKILHQNLNIINWREK